MSFLRAENCISGTSTTGTGTLTLAACPSPPGGVDAFAAFTGLGTSVATPTTYTIIEYTDSTFVTAKQMENGVGLLTLGASVSATTLARTTVQATATGMNTSTPTYNSKGPSAITIGTAANTLVMIAPSAADILGSSPYIETSGDAVGIPYADAVGTPTGGSLNSGQIAPPTDNYIPFTWMVPMLVKRCTVNVQATPATTNNADARLYEISTTGRPGKLLYDFGLFGSSNASFNTTGLVSTGAAGSGFFLQPGHYFLDLTYTSSGSTNTFLQIEGSPTAVAGLTPPAGGRMGTISTGIFVMSALATSATIGAAPDPANVTGYTLQAAGVGGAPNGRFIFWFKAS